MLVRWGSLFVFPHSNGLTVANLAQDPSLDTLINRIVKLVTSSIDKKRNKTGNSGLLNLLKDTALKDKKSRMSILLSENDLFCGDQGQWFIHFSISAKGKYQ